jgi:hypothetical protein
MSKAANVFFIGPHQLFGIADEFFSFFPKNEKALTVLPPRL